MLSENIDQPYL